MSMCRHADMSDAGLRQLGEVEKYFFYANTLLPLICFR